MMMHSIKKSIKRNFERHYLNFRKYAFIGVIFSLLEIFFLWIFIDMMKSPILITTVIVIGLSTLFKFYSYVLSGMMKHMIIRYVFVLAIFYILNVSVVWTLINIGFSAAISSALAAIALFLLRFLIYDKFQMLKNKSS